MNKFSLPFKPMEKESESAQEILKAENQELFKDSNEDKLLLLKSFNYLSYESLINKAIMGFLYRNIDKVRVFSEFSSVLAFCLIFDEHREKIAFYYPSEEEERDYAEYGYYEYVFQESSTIQRLEWILENCGCIPMVLRKENFDTVLSEKKPISDLCYKFAHIKRNKQLYEKLTDYLETLEYLPKNSAYYYICFNRLGEIFLKRYREDTILLQDICSAS